MMRSTTFKLVVNMIAVRCDDHLISHRSCGYTFFCFFLIAYVTYIVRIVAFLVWRVCACVNMHTLITIDRTEFIM